MNLRIYCQQFTLSTGAYPEIVVGPYSFMIQTGTNSNCYIPNIRTKLEIQKQKSQSALGCIILSRDKHSGIDLIFRRLDQWVRRHRTDLYKLLLMPWVWCSLASFLLTLRFTFLNDQFIFIKDKPICSISWYRTW